MLLARMVTKELHRQYDWYGSSHVDYFLPITKYIAFRNGYGT